MNTGAVSLGVAGSLGAELIARLAPEVEEAGFRALWVNDTPDGDAVAALAAAARTTERLILATGVIPVDRRPAPAIAADLDAAGIPADRLLLGIGSGASRSGALQRVAQAVELLRGRVSAPIIVGALGPRMRALGAERADGILLNWVPAPSAVEQAGAARDASPTARVAVYVRTAVDPAARSRLEAEAARYASFPNYAAHFARLRTDALRTTLPDAAAVRAGIRAYAAAGEVVLRAVTATDELADYLGFVHAVAPVLRG